MKDVKDVRVKITDEEWKALLKYIGMLDVPKRVLDTIRPHTIVKAAIRKIVDEVKQAEKEKRGDEM